jgi:hypothetical protein
MRIDPKDSAKIHIQGDWVWLPEVQHWVHIEVYIRKYNGKV